MKPSCSKTTKQQRLDHANELIRIIGSHGRRFFYNAKHDRFARLELRNGRVWWIDDYTETPVYTHQSVSSRWRGFSHGGTLRSLAESMRDYVAKGTFIPRWKIVIQQLGHNDLKGNIWGYPVEAALAVRAAAYALPIIEPIHPSEHNLANEQ